MAKYLFIFLLLFSCVFEKHTVNKGLQYFESSDYEKAIKTFSRILEKDPENLSALEFRGKSYLLIEQHSKGIADLEKALSIQPSSQIHNALGDFYFREGIDSLAWKHFHLAASLGGWDDFLSRRNLGVLYMRLGHYVDAWQQFNHVVRLMPNDPESYYLRGSAYFVRDYNDFALEDLTKAIELDNTVPAFYLKRGAIYADDRKFELALKDFTQAANLNPHDYEPYYSKALVFNSIDQKDSLCINLKKAYELNPALFATYIEVCREKSP